MSYQNPIVCKEIYLPLSDNEGGDGIYIKEYKERYGIDLKEFLSLDDDNKTISINFGNAKVYIVNEDWGEKSFYISVFPIKTDNSNQAYVAESVDGYLYFPIDSSSEYGIKFQINNDEEFKIDNVRVIAYEI